MLLRLYEFILLQGFFTNKFQNVEEVILMNRVDKFYKNFFIDQYGSRRGIIRTYWHRIKSLLGIYGNYKKVDWEKVDRLVFVCKGNICRSAYAEAVARSLGINAISCGISTIIDDPANVDAVEIAGKRGMNLEQHKTTPIMYVILRKTDLLVAMEPRQADFLNKNLKRSHYITLLGIWLSPLRPHVQDPYGLSSTYFDNCFEYIEKSVHEITKKIKI